MVESKVALLNQDVLELHIDLNETPDDGLLYYIGPAPADKRASFNGSGLPFMNMEQAFTNPTIGAVKQAHDGIFVFRIRLPNSYYTEVGNKLVRPHLNITFFKNKSRKNVFIDLNYYIPYRSLYPLFKESDPMNYSGRFDLPIMNQDKLLRSYAYPESPMPTDSQHRYWGMKPPNG